MLEQGFWEFGAAAMDICACCNNRTTSLKAGDINAAALGLLVDGKTPNSFDGNTLQVIYCLCLTVDSYHTTYQCLLNIFQE